MQAYLTQNYFTGRPTKRGTGTFSDLTKVSSARGIDIHKQPTIGDYLKELGRNGTQSNLR